MHALKAQLPRKDSEPWKVTDSRFSQLSNAPVPIYVRVSGISTSLIPLARNALSPIFVKFSKEKYSSEVHPKNASSGI